MDLLVLLLLVASSTYTSAAPPPDYWKDEFHHFRNFEPISYDVFIHTGMRGMLSYGKVSFVLNVLNTTNYLVMNVALNTVDEHYEVIVNRTKKLNITKIFRVGNGFDEVLQTAEPMMKGDTVKMNAVFNTEFRNAHGILIDGYYHPQTGERNPVVLSVFKPDWAKTGFPSFDHPMYRTRFTVTIRHKRNFTAQSNMPVESVTIFDSNWTDTKFIRSPRLSINSVSFVVSNYVFKNRTSADGRLHRLWMGPHRIDQVDYALDEIVRINDYLADELGNITTLDKIDHFGVGFATTPTGHHHFGLNFYLFGDLTFNKSHSDVIGAQRNQIVLGNGVAASYFGGVVTCRDWNHVWLEFVMADYYGMKVAALNRTIWLAELERKEEALFECGEGYIYPVAPVAIVSEYLYYADLLYSQYKRKKGACLLKMLEDYMGWRRFRHGVRRYLRLNWMKSVLTKDLLDALQAEAEPNTNIAEVMDAWLFSPGFPLITMQLLPDNKINITQKRFLRDSSADPDDPPSPNGYKWFIPLNFQTEGKENGRFLMKNETSMIITNPSKDNDSWTLFNYNQAGYFRINYAPEQWQNLTTQLMTNHSVFLQQQRAQVVLDALSIADGNQLSFDTVLNLLRYAPKERSVPIWTGIQKTLKRMNDMLSNTTDYPLFNKFVLNLTTDFANELKVRIFGYPEKKNFRQMILSLACRAGHKGCMQNTTRMFKDWILNDTKNAIHPDLRHLVYCYGIANSENVSDFETTLSRFLVLPQGDGDRGDMLKGMACTRNLTLVERLLNTSVSNTTKHFLYDEIDSVFAALSIKPATNDFALSWIKRNVPALQARHGQEEPLFFVGKLAEVYNTQDKFDEIVDYMNVLKTYDCVDDAWKRRTNKIMRRNMRWINGHHATISTWLEDNFST